MSRLLTRRIDRVADHGTRHWAWPGVPYLPVDRLTAAECEAAARVRGRLDAAGPAGIGDEDLAFCRCLQERMSGERTEPCVLGAG